MSRVFTAAFTLLFCLPVSATEFRVLNRPLQGDPIYVIPPGICGNGVAEDGEECDPGYPDLGVEPDLGDATCENLGFDGGGELACTPKCTLDLRGCSCEAGTGFPATGQTRCWDGDGIEVDCGGTGHDGDIRAGVPLAYTDNGDGTITDRGTGLMWEKKTRALGIHSVSSTYTWERSFSVFLAALNGTCEGAGERPCEIDDECEATERCGFAGYNDWRIPNVKELHSIVNYDVPYPGPTVNPAFDSHCTTLCTHCSCTGSSLYWTSSSSATYPGFAWSVYFDYGSVNFSQKNVSYFGLVRAVRGGLD